MEEEDYIRPFVTGWGRTFKESENGSDGLPREFHGFKFLSGIFMVWDKKSQVIQNKYDEDTDETYETYEREIRVGRIDERREIQEHVYVTVNYLEHDAEQVNKIFENLSKEMFNNKKIYTLDL